jgi:hypothetical protein
MTPLHTTLIAMIVVKIMVTKEVSFPLQAQLAIQAEHVNAVETLIKSTLSLYLDLSQNRLKAILIADFSQSNYTLGFHSIRHF